MKGIKTLVSATAIAVCLGAASMANAVSITPAGTYSPLASGTITVKSPSSLQAAVTCNISFDGTVNADGTVDITGASVSGSNQLCGLPKMKIPPAWKLTATSLTGSTAVGNVTNVGYTITFPPFPATNCGPSTIAVAFDNTTHKLTASNQALSGSCTVVTLDVTASALTVIP
ncbi:alkane oxidation protein activator PraB [Pseudomonas gingeri]